MEKEKEKEKENQLVAQSPTPAVFNFFDPQQFEVMQRVCKMFANSELVPDMYKVSEKNVEAKAVANCMIAISLAMRIGADPLMIMQNMVIIYGRPSWSSKFLVATVNTCGRFNPLQYRFTEKGMLGKVDYTEYTKTWINGVNGGKGYYKTDAKPAQFDGTKIMNIECVAFTTAKGSNDVLESSPISIKMAVQEGWYQKNGSKWQTMTKQMLMYRAASFWTNVHAPELSMGMKTDDEVRDIIDVDFEDMTEKVEREKSANANKTNISITAEETETATAPEPTPDEKPVQEQSKTDGKQIDKPIPGF